MRTEQAAHLVTTFLNLFAVIHQPVYSQTVPTLANFSQPRTDFLSAISDGIVCLVKFNLRYSVGTGQGSSSNLDVTNWDTFSPNAWIWAADKCRNLLRLPLDHVVLSLGILSIQQARVDVTFDEQTGDNLTSLPFDQSSDIIARFLSQEVTYNATIGTQPADSRPVICRSAYAFEHPLHGYTGVGYKCCVPPLKAGDKYICDTPYTESWELVWYGPIVLMFWIYLIGAIHFYWLYRHSFFQKKVREVAGFEKTIDEIKLDVVNRLVEAGQRFARIESPEELISLRERCGFFEVLGIGKARHSRITTVLRISLGVLLFSVYYVFWALLIYEYKVQIGSELAMLDNSRKIFLNVVGRIGWLFTPTNTGCFRYEIFESVYTGLVPFLAIIVYASIAFNSDSDVGSKDPNRCDTKVLKALRDCFRSCFSSKCGKIFQSICFLLFIIHFICVGGVFLAYVVYFVGLGIFANVDVVSPWIIPILICVHFFNTSFDPAYRNYQVIKDATFTICLDHFEKVVFRASREIFLPRDLVETFYIPNSRSTIYSCVLRIFWLIAVIFLLILIVLTIQYPYNKKLTSVVAFLGVQVVFILPLFAKMLNTNNSLSPLEETVLKRDLQVFIKNYIAEHPDLVKIKLTKKKKVPTATLR